METSVIIQQMKLIANNDFTICIFLCLTYLNNHSSMKSDIEKERESVKSYTCVLTMSKSEIDSQCILSHSVILSATKTTNSQHSISTINFSNCIPKLLASPSIPKLSFNRLYPLSNPFHITKQGRSSFRAICTITPILAKKTHSTHFHSHYSSLVIINCNSSYSIRIILFIINNINHG